MLVAVAIVGFRNWDDILRCLAALGKSNYRKFEVIICENGGPEAFARLIARIPRTLANGQPVKAVLASGNLGYAGGINVCLQETKHADAWWILNPDTAPSPSALSLLVNRLAQGNCDAVGGTLYMEDGTVQSHGGRWQSLFAHASSIGFGTPVDKAVNQAAVENNQNYLMGASMLVGRRFVEVAGPMREDYFLYCEEVEWCLRAIKRGLHLGFAPGAHVLHYQSTTTNAERSIHPTRLMLYLGMRNKLLATRDCFPFLIPIAATVSLIHTFAHFRRYGGLTGLNFALSGWLAGLFNRRSLPSWIQAERPA